MIIELWKEGYDEPERVIIISTKNLAAKTRKKWINDVKNLKDKYFIVIKNTGR